MKKPTRTLCIKMCTCTFFSFYSYLNETQKNKNNNKKKKKTKTKKKNNNKQTGNSYNLIADHFHVKSKKISNDQELIQSDPTSCPQNKKGNN